MSELKRCPFCGGEAQLHLPESDNECTYVYCLDCHAVAAKFIDFTGGDGKSLAIPAWNHRPRADWIKVTPETMPLDVEKVIATVQYPDGSKQTKEMHRWNEDTGLWEYFDMLTCSWEIVLDTVTHWMPYPDPAED